jgi:SAM-dependent methyltransferase
MRYRICVGLVGFLALPFSLLDDLGPALLALCAGVVTCRFRSQAIASNAAVSSVVTRLGTGFLATRGGHLAAAAQVERLVDSLGLGGGELVLDVRAGSALMSEAISQRLTTGRLYHLDLGPARVNEVVFLPSVRLLPGGALPFPDNSFDLVTARLAMHAVAEQPTRARIVREMIRVLKPHGQLVLADQDVQQYVRLLRGAGLRDAHSRPESLLTLPRVDVLTAWKPVGA